MAELKLTAANAKGVTAAETVAAEGAGVVLDVKKGIVTLADNETIDSDITLDVSGSAFFKSVVATGYSGDLDFKGSGTVANVVSVGGGTENTLDGGAGVVDDSGAKVKITAAADKFYGAADGSSSNTYVYKAFGGKDVIYNYSDGDQIMLVLGDEQTIDSIVDKSGGIVVTLKDESESAAASLAAKNSVLTVDGKSLKATQGYTFVNAEGDTIYEYGKRPTGVEYGVNKKGATDTTALLVTGDAKAKTTVDVKTIASTVKTINASAASRAVNIIGNSQGNNITIGSGGGTIDGGNAGTKATNDNLYGNASGSAVTFVYNDTDSLGGKDVIYNYKSTDNIIITGEITSQTLKGTDAVFTLGKNSLTVKNALGKAINVNGEVQEDLSYTLPSGLNYDAKRAKITADNTVISSGDTVDTIDITLSSESSGGVKNVRTSEVGVYATIFLGGEYTSFEESVKDIDMSTSSAPVVIDTSGNASVTSVKVGKVGSTVTGNTSVQTFTAGGFKDLFIINIDTVLDSTVKSPKCDTIVNLMPGDSVQLTGGEAEISANNITLVEKGKDVNVTYTDEDGNAKIVATLKNVVTNFEGSKISLPILVDGKTITEYPKPMPSGLSYALTKKGTADKTGLIADSTFTSNAILAEDYGGSTIKKIDASSVTSASSLIIVGSDAANSLYAPTANVSTTLDGGAGNDNLIGSSDESAGEITYKFTATTKGTKDVIWNYKEGDLIVIDASAVEGFSISEEGITYTPNTAKPETTADGFNDTKADVVVTVNKSNTITIKNAAGKNISFATVSGDSDDSDNDEDPTAYTFGHKPPEGLAYDAKNTTVTLQSGASYRGAITLSDTKTYYSTVKKVDMTGNTAAAKIYGNTLANEFISGSKGGLMDGGSIFDSAGEVIQVNGKDIKPTADKLYGGEGKDTYVYDVAYGKDSFLSFGNGDVVSLGSGISADNLSITDKKNVLTVALVNADEEDTLISSEKGAVNTTANSTFTITKTSAGVAVNFVNGDGSEWTYGELPKGVEIDTTKYASLTATAALQKNTIIDASAINSQPKIIDAKAATVGAVLIGNAQADAIYAGTGGSTMFGGTAGTKAVKDQLYGGSGQDYFVFSTQDGLKGKETDIVYNYNYEDGDVIVLDKAPDSVKADGKTITLTWNEEVEVGTKTSKVASTLVINGTLADNDNGAYKKFNAITSSNPVTFAIGAFTTNETTGNLELSSDTATTYIFDNTATDEDGNKSSLKGGKAAWGEDPGIQVYDPSASQYSANVEDYWFTEDSATADVVSSDLDAILDGKGATANVATQFNADSYFTEIGEDKSAAVSALALAARRHAKK